MPHGVVPAADQIAAAAFRPPGPADETMLRIWDDLVGITSRMGVLTEADGLALWGLACDLRQIFALEDLSLQARARGDRLGGLLWRKTKKDGTADTNSYPVVSPVFYARRPLMAGVLSLFREFGLTPSARTRVQSLGGAEREQTGGLLDGEWRPQQTAPIRRKRKCVTSESQTA